MKSYSAYMVPAFMGSYLIYFLALYMKYLADLADYWSYRRGVRICSSEGLLDFPSLFLILFLHMPPWSGIMIEKQIYQD
jgi:hypothetical protein